MQCNATLNFNLQCFHSGHLSVWLRYFQLLYISEQCFQRTCHLSLQTYLLTIAHLTPHTKLSLFFYALLLQQIHCLHLWKSCPLAMAAAWDDRISSKPQDAKLRGQPQGAVMFYLDRQRVSCESRHTTVLLSCAVVTKGAICSVESAGHLPQKLLVPNPSRSSIR